MSGFAASLPDLRFPINSTVNDCLPLYLTYGAEDVGFRCLSTRPTVSYKLNSERLLAALPNLRGTSMFIRFGGDDARQTYDWTSYSSNAASNATAEGSKS